MQLLNSKNGSAASSFSRASAHTPLPPSYALAHSTPPRFPINSFRPLLSPLSLSLSYTFNTPPPSSLLLSPFHHAPPPLTQLPWSDLVCLPHQFRAPLICTPSAPDTDHCHSNSGWFTPILIKLHNSFVFWEHIWYWSIAIIGTLQSQKHRHL